MTRISGTVVVFLGQMMGGRHNDTLVRTVLLSSQDLRKLTSKSEES